ncbi:hypothetical protein TNCV_2994081 [Trichonephila clavipes]|nr:hypothetical protein TNCV_2994081 [Trichonephila clavipes]
MPSKIYGVEGLRHVTSAKAESLRQLGVEVRRVECQLRCHLSVQNYLQPSSCFRRLSRIKNKHSLTPSTSTPILFSYEENIFFLFFLMGCILAVKLCTHGKSSSVRAISLVAPSNGGPRFQILTLEFIQFKFSSDAKYCRDLILSRAPDSGIMKNIRISSEDKFLGPKANLTKGTYLASVMLWAT